MAPGMQWQTFFFCQMICYKFLYFRTWSIVIVPEWPDDTLIEFPRHVPNASDRRTCSAEGTVSTQTCHVSSAPFARQKQPPWQWAQHFGPLTVTWFTATLLKQQYMRGLQPNSAIRPQQTTLPHFGKPTARQLQGQAKQSLLPQKRMCYGALGITWTHCKKTNCWPLGGVGVAVLYMKAGHHRSAWHITTTQLCCSITLMSPSTVLQTILLCQILSTTCNLQTWIRLDKATGHWLQPKGLAAQCYHTCGIEIQGQAGLPRSVRWPANYHLDTALLQVCMLNLGTSLSATP